MAKIKLDSSGKNPGSARIFTGAPQFYAFERVLLLPVLLALLFYIPITLHLSAASLRSWNEGDPSPLLTHSLDSIHLYRQSRRTS